MGVMKALLALFGVYAALVGVLYLAQRKMMYFPDPARRAPAASGLPQAEESALRASDGERLLAWHIPPQNENPVVLYFQGNAGGLDLRAARFAKLAKAGIGVLALNYRGYGGSTGSPSEEGILRDADAAYAFALSRYPAGRIAVWGESLGTGVAVALAAERAVARVVLEAPYTSTADVAASIYWFVPVRLLLRDQFRSDERIAKVTAPILIVHGARDEVIPIRYGERLYDLVRAPKHFIRLPDAGHNDADDHGALEAVRSFLLGAAL